MPAIAPPASLSPSVVILLALASIATFHLGFSFPPLGALLLVYLGALVALRRAPGTRWAFYTGFAIGLGVLGPQLGFFWGIFGPAAVVLWLILAFWHGIFLLLLHQVHERAGGRWVCLGASVLWLGVEYFRSELYYLRFAWLTVGYALPLEVTRPLLPMLGVYGWGALAMALAAGIATGIESALRGGAWTGLWRRPRTALALIALVLVPILWNKGAREPSTEPTTAVRVAGVQMEFPGAAEVLQNLRRLPAACPDAELVVLSEYTFDGPVPDGIRAWCRQARRWMVAGGKEPLADGRFHNMAYVVDTNGAIVFRQAKAVPIQFFNDGEPAPAQKVWESPWGTLGLCVCYDLNYARVADRLIRQGARALIVPTMDVESWGLHEHHLNARLASIRAAEYGVPIFRVASSGFSQLIDDRGQVQASTTVPGPGDLISGELRLVPRASAGVPLDRFAAPAAFGATLAIAFGLARLAWSSHRAKRSVGHASAALNHIDAT